MDEYISIKEFASKVGLTSQAIYQRIDKDLKPFLKLVENKKTLNIKALELFGFKEVEQPIEQGVDKELLKSLQDTLKVLTSQITVKDQQIEALNDRLKEAQELNRNNQILLSSEQSRTNLSLLTDDGEVKTENLAISWWSKVFKRKK